MDTPATPSTISIDLLLSRGKSFYRATISQEKRLFVAFVAFVLLIDPFVILSSDTFSISISAVRQRSRMFGKVIDFTIGF